ncbi:hypothetical protein [Salinilacihabitans rarus]|uniref:hypothetical protein n=1 Tax=Salinilacihabitans rarus TaxID=2961596 RepID=UPI0020C8715F|nr:hypothetical protein [Salinilacihabitans rarus]
MTPVVFLAVFCATMAAIAAIRLALAEERDPADAGTALLTVAIAAFATLWPAVEESWLSTGGLLVLSVAGALSAAGGIALLAYE